MSDIGVLSQDYQNTAELFHAINQAVILIKKRFYQLAGAAQVSEQQLLQARQALRRIVSELIANLQSPTEDAALALEQEESTSIPAFLIRRIEEKHQGDLHWYLEDLRELRRTLEAQEPFTEAQIGYLDELCKQFDSETSALHRRLWRK